MAKGIIEALLSGKTYAVITDPPLWIKNEQNFHPIPPQEVAEINKTQKEINTVKKDGSTGADNTGEDINKNNTQGPNAANDTVLPLGNIASNAPPAPVYGTARAGASCTITLASGSSVKDNYYNGKKIRITEGTGVGQVRFISGYIGSTNVATVSSAWAITPDSTSTYAIEEVLGNSSTPATGDNKNGEDININNPQGKKKPGDTVTLPGNTLPNNGNTTPGLTSGDAKAPVLP
jgi:hypothetical protein